MKLTIKFIFPIWLISALLPLQADIIYLKNGKTARGKIISQTLKSVKIQWINGGTKIYPKKEIKRIKFETIDLKAEKAKKEAQRKKRQDALRRKKEEQKRKQLAKEREAEEKRKKEIEKKQKQNEELAEYRKKNEIKLQQLEKEKTELLKKQTELEKQNQILKDQNNKNKNNSEKIKEQKKSDLLAAHQKWQTEQKEREQNLRIKLNQDFASRQKQQEEAHKRKLDKERADLEAEYANKSKSQYESMSSSQGSALWRSAILPGWGQHYKGESVKGYSFMGAWAVLLGASVVSNSRLLAARADFDDLTLTWLGLASKNTSLVILDQIQATSNEAAYTKAARQFNLSVVLLAGFYVYNIFDVSSIQKQQAELRQQSWRPRFDLAIVPEDVINDDYSRGDLFGYDGMRMQAEVWMRW